MASLEERGAAAIIGSTVADAACLPVHWIYSSEKLNSVLDQYEHPEFIKESHNPFYCIPTGSQSCYGDQGYAVLKSLVESHGFNKDHLSKTFNSIFGPSSAYEQKDTGTEKKRPIMGPWRNGSLREFVKNFDAGMAETGSKADTQTDAITKIAPVVALYAGRPEMLDKVKEVVTVTQCHEMPLALALFTARILERIILHGHEADVVSKVLSDLGSAQRSNPLNFDSAVPSLVQKVIDLKGVKTVQAVEGLGKSCALPGAFQGALHAILYSESYVNGVRNTLRSGGDNCSRSCIVGMCLGARFGLAGIPEDWRKQTAKYNEVAELAKQLAQIRSTLE